MKALLRVAYRCAYRLLLCYWFVFRPTEQGAYVAVWFEDKLLLIKNTYKSGYTFPAGGIHRGESDRAAAARELSEEVGIRVPQEQLERVGEFQSTSEFKLDLSTVFELRLQKKPDVKIDEVEVSQFEFVARDALSTRNLTSIARQYIDWKTAHN